MKLLTTTGQDLPIAVLNYMQDDFVYEPVEQPEMLKTLKVSWNQPDNLIRVGDDHVFDYNREQRMLTEEQRHD